MNRTLLLGFWLAGGMGFGVPVQVAAPDPLSSWNDTAPKRAIVAFIEKAGKPIGIHLHIGRRPVMACGNSDGDFQMLEWTTRGPGARFGLLVHHDDAAREAAYDRASPIGRLDQALDEAPKRGWTVVSMKDDWKVVFAPGR